MNGWISCNRMWEVIKYVLIIPLGLQKGLLRSWKRNIKKMIRPRKNRRTQLSEQWKSMKAKNGPFSPRSFSGTDQFYFIDFQCSLSCVRLFFSCAPFSIFFSFTLVFYFKLWLFWDRLWWQSFSSVKPFLLTWFSLDIIITF